MYVALPARPSAAPHTRTASWRDLADEAWMLGSTGDVPRHRRSSCAPASAAGFEPRVAFQSNDYLAIQGFVAAGVGVSFIPDLALVTVRDDIAIRSLGAAPPVRRIMAATLERLLLLPGAARRCSTSSSRSASEFAGGRRELALAG